MKKYYYKGKEVSHAKANLMVIGAWLGVAVTALGMWAVASLMIGIFG